jgi:hypothetical protein
MKKKQKSIAQKYRLVLLPLIVVIPIWVAQIAGAIAAPRLQGEDAAEITNPTNSAVVSEVIPITGSADYPTFQFYIVEFHPEPVTGDQWQIVGQIHETPVLNGQLETWDTRPIPDGSYTLRLRVVRLDGNYSEAFVQQVVVSNSQTPPTPAAPPEGEEEEVVPGVPLIPTVTPTDLPPTPTILIDQPIVDTPTPRPTETPVALADPGQSSSLIPSVTGFSMSPLQNACLFGAGIMLSVFLFFGFLAALRTFIIGFVQQWQRKSR